MGSGSLNAMSVFESGYKEDMTKEEAMELVARAIKGGIYNDLGSGSNVDLCIITKDGKEYLRNYETLTEKTYHRQKPVVFPPGTAGMFPSKCPLPVVLHLIGSAKFCIPSPPKDPASFLTATAHLQLLSKSSRGTSFLFLL